MDVVKVGLKIGLISDRVLPIAPLPDSLLTFGDAAVGAFGGRTASEDQTGERGLDQAHARRIVGVALRQCPEHVDMVR
jgi:hypothetical protein